MSSSNPTPTSPQNSTKRISFIDNGTTPSTPTRKASKSIDSPLNSIVASRSRAKSSPMPQQNPTSPTGMTSPISKGPLNFSVSSPTNNNSNGSSFGSSVVSVSSSTPSSSTASRRLSISSGAGLISPQKKEGRRERLSMVFRLFDKDQDDKLNPEEMNDFLTSVYNGPESKEFLSMIKTSHKEGVTFDEFVKLCRDDVAASKREAMSKSPSKGRGRSQSIAVSSNQSYKSSISPLAEHDEDDGFTDEDLKSVFSEILDVNDDGVVSMSEFKKVIANLGIQQTFSDEELSILFDGSKTLSFDQFRKLVM